MKQTFFGLTPREIAKVVGISENSVYRYLNGSRKVGTKNALKLNAVLGIPLWIMRPDIWSVPQSEKKEISATSRTCEPGSGNPLSLVTRKPGAGELMED